MMVLSFLLFFSIIGISMQNPYVVSDRFSLVNTNSANLSDYDSFLVYSNNFDRIKCLTTCRSVPICRAILFIPKSQICKIYSTIEYFSHDQEQANIEVFDRFSQGVIINTHIFHSDIVMSIVKLNNGFLASGSLDNTIKVFDPSKNMSYFTLQEPSCNGIYSLKVLNDEIIASGCGDGKILIWNINNLSLVETLNGHFAPVKFLLIINDQIFTSASAGKSVRIWNTTSRTCIKTLQNHTNSVFSLALLAEDTLASGSVDMTINIWNLKTYSIVKSLIGHRDAVYYLITINNGNLVSASRDSTIRIWNVMLGQTVMILTGHSSAIRSLLMYGENVLISGDYGGKMKVWDLTTGKSKMTLLGHTDKCMSMVKLGNGSLASGSADNTIKIWNI